MLNGEYWSTFTFNSDDYELGPVIGFGASSTVYSALFTPPNTQSPTSPSASSTPADFYHSGSNPTLQSRHAFPAPGTSRKPHLSITLPAPSSLPTALVSGALEPGTSSHSQGVRPILATFTLPPDYQRIALVTPLISGGSLAGILDWRSRLATTPKTNHTFKFGIGHKRKEEEDGHTGLEEEEIKAITKQVLEGLKYLHERGYIHRDLKAGNLLVDDDGTILLADLGVGGDMNLPPSPVSEKSRRTGVEEIRFEPTMVNRLGPGKAASMTPTEEDWGRRKSFVGTPNWMAPEVILGRRYDGKADIWSLGITILELAYGAVPGSKIKSKDILTRIITEPPPTLDRMGKFSRHMREFVDTCLVKEPDGSVLPSSPRVSLRQWAERSASVEGEYTVGLGIRTGSEKGKTRSSSVAPAYSSRKTTSFDLPRPTSTPSSSRLIDGASSMRRTRELGAMRSEDSTAQDDERVMAPMSPLMEVGKTEAHSTEIPPLNLNENFAGLEIRSDGLEMRSSPDPLPARPDDPESIPPVEIPKETSRKNDHGAAAPEVWLG
ncbi:STE/STE20/FRAY protein kinase [Cryptococcus deuterogattii 99/473]|uniref:STE/STE20/FRAY protein kinase n=1 Tax=Cryptococcus deuterogattii Ram5 TaxID=1296110 RepID=A0A0D0VCI3_9TREE|nr:STE/STE20/FRAY protein kinase [Cryptococcus deuterogattii LA55]KIR35810.1 STE/STE20/FRAY protein kinase [Cryptococcus deuterogattii MMRL2647]KIR42540.1 STE/STE20/FRAY protein kinase [Cryptococcus deuterogattii Ram5]KIR72634.1 STE/STE20/FRAY protein kinase [Cryptococcus deuterogattii CA1014]KIR95184.1 STE/STE20/FRAY protein kinase [Cryptococcus deuterogattii CBS 10090]KIS00294.1 STE/STE20/FRAY protein kinase [Cryptococcus deuterogattii 2001/935-1]KIY56110.1 STE/STE20/FRAY protein kinase [Cr